VNTYQMQRNCPQCPTLGLVVVNVTVVTPWDIRYSHDLCGHTWATPKRWIPA
jgi:hypothetical protein